MRKNATIRSLFVFVLMCLLTSCSGANTPITGVTLPPEQTYDLPSPTSTIASVPKPTQKDIVSQVEFSSAEEAYYSKYVELAKRYGSYSLCDYYRIKDSYEHSYLNGVCIVNLMDFNRDGIQDLFVVYSNSNMDTTVSDSDVFEVYDFPTRNTYEYEIWTYKEGKLTQILHEPYVSLCYKYADYWPPAFTEYYSIFMTVYENANGFPVIQIYNESDRARNYTNIYYSDGQITRDRLTYNGDSFQMNDSEITEDIWDKNVVGYRKILLCSLLANSSESSSALLDGYNIDYNNTLRQTDRVLRYLSQHEKDWEMQSFDITEDEYISLYLQVIGRSNRQYHETADKSERTYENHYYILYDLDQNGVPELILYEGSSGAGTHYHFYTIINHEVKECGFYGRTSLHADGKGGLIAYYGRSTSYYIQEIKLIGESIVITDIASGVVLGDADFPELNEFGYDNYEYLAFCPPAIPAALYTYNLSDRTPQA